MIKGKKIWAWAGLFLVAALMLAACAPAAPEVVEVEKIVEVEVEKIVEKIVEVPAEVEDVAKEVIIFHDAGWSTIQILNQMAMFITENGYGYPVEEVTVSSDVMWTSLPLGDEHVNMELWRMNNLEVYDAAIASGNLVDLGQSFERSAQGWYVPTYTAEAEGLVTIQDAIARPDLFPDPEDPSKGLWVNCKIGWNCQKILRVKAAFYGMDEDSGWNVMEPGEGSAIAAAIAGAYGREEPFLSYYWEPTAVTAAYDLTLLTEEPYSAECWEKVSAAVQEEPFGTVDEACAFEQFDIHKGVYGGLLDRAPDVVAFLKNMFVGNARIGELDGWMADNEATAAETAIYFLTTYPDQWTEWVPAEVADEVTAALP